MLRSGGTVVMVIVALMVLQASLAQGRTTSCQGQYVRCERHCDTYLGLDGCPKCDCHRTCELMDCRDGQICEMQVQPCQKPPCPSKPVCVEMGSTTPCPMVKCAPGCESVRGPNGCSRCECPRTCEDIKCSGDDECVLKQIKQCITTPCFPTPICVPRNGSTTPCPVVTCAPGCVPVRGPNGCSSCECRRTCETTVCQDGYECVIRVYPCFRAPCPTFPVCVPRGSTTPCPAVTCATGCVTVTGPNGCSSCACPRTCEDIKCAEDEECVLKQIKQCIPTPCFPTPICVPRNGSTTPCPMVTCAPGCVPVRGTNGCSRCECRRTCETTVCQDGYECVIRVYPCLVAPCPTYPVCVAKGSTTPCPAVTCATGCVPVRGPNGCSSCACPRTCEGIKCAGDEECVLKQIKQCIPTPCFPTPICVPRNGSTTPCPMVTCATGCKPVRGPNGCSKCECPPTCENVTCTKDEECVLEPVVCKTFPCFPVPTCVPKNKSCTAIPNTGRCGNFTFRWTYNSTTDSCQGFSYYGCTPSPNTFGTLKACEDKCKLDYEPICINYVCDDNCYKFTKENQCPRCICPNPCKDFNCSANEVCKLKEVVCVTEPCDPIPYCAPIENDERGSCQELPLCDLLCSNGFKTDENGCRLCECNENPIPY